jgi:folate-binding protein YgfZ
MTEAIVSASTPTIPATPLAALLESAATPHQLTAYCGALTPLDFDAPAGETAALAFGAAIHDLGWLKRVAVRGEDSFRWLSGMVSNRVNDLAPNTGAWNLVLNAQGRIQGDLTVWREGSELELEIAADQYEKLLAHLDRFIIMDDVELIPLTGEAALGLTGPAAVEVLGRLNLPTLEEPLSGVRIEWNGLDLRILRGYGVLAPHYEIWVPETGLKKLWKYLHAAGTTPVGCASLEAFRIAEGIPVYGIDIAERDLPQETSQMRALNFNKGCYLGQEIVERIHSRGSVHRHLRQLELTGPVPTAGAKLTMADGSAAGEITSAAELLFAGVPTDRSSSVGWLAAGNRVFALSMMRGEAELSNQPLTYTVGSAAGSARILAAPPIFNPEPIGNTQS